MPGPVQRNVLSRWDPERASERPEVARDRENCTENCGAPDPRGVNRGAGSGLPRPAAVIMDPIWTRSRPDATALERAEKARIHRHYETGGAPPSLLRRSTNSVSACAIAGSIAGAWKFAMVLRAISPARWVEVFAPSAAQAP